MRKNATGKKPTSFSRMPLETPVIYPDLKRPINLLNQDSISKAQSKEIGKYSISLLSSLSLSIYKKLFAKNVNKDTFFNYQDIKNIRNLYLKRLVESNQDNFPYELSQDEYKVVEISKDEKIRAVIDKMKMAGKNEKIRRDYANNLDISRRSSTNRKESLDETKKINDRTKKDKNINSASNVNKSTIQNNNSNSNQTKNNQNSDNESDNDNNSQSYEDEDNYINDVNGDDSENNEGDYSVNMDEGGEY